MFRPVPPAARSFGPSSKLSLTSPLSVRCLSRRRYTRARELGLVGEEVAAVERQHLQLVAGLVGAREDRLPALLEERLRGETVTDQIGIRDRQTHVPLEAAPSLPDLREELLHVRRRVVAPAVLVEPRAGDVSVKAVLEGAAGLELSDEALPRPPGELERDTRMRVAALRSQRQRAAEGVESEQRIGSGHERDAVERRLRNQVPGDDVAERGVYPDTVLVDGETLRRPEQRGGGKAPVVDVGLIRIALDVVDVDARHPQLQLLRNVGRGRLLELASADDLDVRRQLVSGYSNTGDRCRCHHVDGWRGDWCALLSCRRGRQRSEHAGHHPSRAGSPRFFLVVHVSSLRCACADRADGCHGDPGKGRARAGHASK